MARLASLLTVAVLALSAPAALAQDQSGPFGPLPQAPPAETPTPTPPPSVEAQQDTDRTLLFVIGGALLVLFVIIGRVITRDARKTLHERAATRRRRRATRDRTATPANRRRRRARGPRRSAARAATGHAIRSAAGRTPATAFLIPRDRHATPSRTRSTARPRGEHVERPFEAVERGASAVVGEARELGSVGEHEDLPRAAERELAPVLAAERVRHRLARGPGRHDEHAVPAEAGEPPQVDLAALAHPDRAGQLQREQVVDRDAVLVAGREHHDREHAEGEREQRADGDQRPCHGGRLAPT